MPRRPMTASLAALAALLPLAACNSMPSGGIGGFRTISRGYQTGLEGSDPYVARTAEEWRFLWGQHASTEVPNAPLPEVDFSREMVVCVVTGDRPSGGYAVEVTEARWDGLRLELVARETRPAPDAVVPMVVTRPYHMVATGRSDGPVRIEMR